MIEPAFHASLIVAVGAAPLLQAGLPCAVVTAIAMSAITVGADVEDRLTMLPAAHSLAQYSRMMKCRVHSLAGRARQWQPLYVRLEPVCWSYLMKVADSGILLRQR